MNLSEYSQKPKAVLMHNPRKNSGITNLNDSELATHNFLATPNTDVLFEEFDKIQAVISSQGIEVLELLDFLEKEDNEEVVTNPNSIFTRDPVITIPWNKKVLIKSNMKINGRKREPELALKALKRVVPDAEIVTIDGGVLEGGDVVPIIHRGQKIFLLGYGNRTEISSAISLMKALGTDVLDVIFCLGNKSLLHLDTALSILSDTFLFLAQKTFDEGYLLDRSLMFDKVNPKEFVKKLGIQTFYVTKDEAMINEVCNLFPVGNATFVGCNISEETKEKVEKQAGITIISIPSKEIAKGTGGVHCLTRPIY